jgi:hypothetical protein
MPNKTFSEILDSYMEADSHLARLESKPRLGTKKKAYYSRMRDYNDKSYFVILFAQFEEHLNQECSKLFQKKMGHPKWRNRILWDTNKAEDLSFKKKLALVTQLGGADFNMIYDWYKNIRCKIAHGTLSIGSAIQIPTIAQLLLSYMSRLKA